MVYSFKYHVIWCPKCRREVLVNGVDVRLKEPIEEIFYETCIDIIKMGIMSDHVHLLMEVDPQFGSQKAVKKRKERTSRALRQEFPWLRFRIPTLRTNSKLRLSARLGPAFSRCSIASSSRGRMESKSCFLLATPSVLVHSTELSQRKMIFSLFTPPQNQDASLFKRSRSAFSISAGVVSCAASWEGQIMRS